MSRPLKVLMAEDNPLDAELVLAQLKRDGFEPAWERVQTEKDFLARLSPDLDLILSDFDMPQFNGLMALQLLKESGLDIPFILVSGTVGEETSVLAMKAGASDYLMKDRLVRLGQAVNHALDQCRLRKESRHASEALRLFRSLVDQSSDSFEVIDPDTGRFIDVNEKGYTSLGYSRSEFLSFRVFDIDPTLEAAGWPTFVANIRANGSVSGEGSHRRKDGTSFPVEFNVKCVKLDRDYIVAIVRDISARKELEARFLRAQRLESVGSITSGIAHDMNNILAPILMAAPMLRMGMSPENTERTLATIEQSAQRGADLVRQLLTFGRGSEGAKRLIRTETLVQEMVKIAQQTFPKNISVIGKESGKLWPVMGDPTQLHQVLLNLCVNARDSMLHGGTLTVSAEAFAFDRSTASMTPGASVGPYVLIQVTDTGKGIATDIVDRIFDPFFTTKAIGKGTGLGLSTVIGIAKSHGGFVNLITKEGKGSTFQVFLPAVPGASEAAAATAPAASPSGHGELVLVVDDEENIRDVTRSILAGHGYQVITANDGADATSQYALRRSEIRAVITDLDMPVMDGVTLVHVLQGMNPAVAVIVSSGVASKAGMESRRAELMSLGVTTILKKPYTVERMLQAVHQAMGEVA